MSSRSEFPGTLLDLQGTTSNSLSIEAKRTMTAAKKCREQFGAAYGLAIGPLPAASLSPAETPLLWFAVATSSDVVVKSSPFVGHPDILKTRGAKQALNLLRLILLKTEPK